MKTLASWAPAPNLTVTAIESGDPDWIVSVDSRDAEQDRDRASCPVCGIQSSSRHSSYIRTLRDLSAQGRRVNIQARLTRWRCRNDQCDRRIFAERLPTFATPFARRTARLAGIVKLFGHSVGGRPSERGSGANFRDQCNETLGNIARFMRREQHSRFLAPCCL